MILYIKGSSAVVQENFPRPMGELQPSLMHYDDYPMNSRQLRKK
jgi:hypothetical protein